MNYLIKATTLFAIALLFFACEEEKKEEIMWISIKNETDEVIDCSLDPVSSEQSGFVEEVSIEPGQFVDIYGSNDIQSNPVELFASVYERLSVSLESGTALSFRQGESPEGYTLDPFSDSTAWQLDTFETSFPENNTSTTAIVWNHQFVIEESKITE